MLDFKFKIYIFKLSKIVKIKNCQVILSLVRFDNKKSYNKIIKFNQLVFGTEMPDRSIGKSMSLPTRYQTVLHILYAGAVTKKRLE